MEKLSAEKEGMVSAALRDLGGQVVDVQEINDTDE
jgi:hypothetical protein